MMKSSVSSPATVFLAHRRELSTPISHTLPRASFSARCSLPPSKPPPRSGASSVHAVMTLAGYDFKKSLSLMKLTKPIVRLSLK